MKTKFNLDRQRLDSSYIQSRQDFDKVVKGYRAMKPPIWKNPWFYGPAGIASIAILLTLTFQNKYFANENNSTLSSNTSNTVHPLPEDTPCIKPPIEALNVDFENFTIDPKKGGQIVTTTGSIITFPKSSINAEHNGHVSIKVREFPDMKSAMLAGIPMDYGDKSAFESGGMIEIRGEQNGKSISINPNIPFQVNMALTKSGDDFKFWSLNDKNGVWTEYPSDLNANLNKSRIENNSSVIVKEKINAATLKIENCEKEIQSLQEVAQKTKLIPQENSRKLVIDFDASQFPELAVYKELEFEYVYPKNQNSAERTAFDKRIKYATSTTWNHMAVSRSKENYIVTFKNTRENYSLPVRPVLKGQSLSDFENKIAQAEKANEESVARKEKEKKQLEKEKKLLQEQYEAMLKTVKKDLNSATSIGENTMPERSASSQTVNSVNEVARNFNGTRTNFISSQFGVFNCDRPFPYPKPFSTEFICKSELGHPIEIVTAYLFDLKLDVRFTYGIPNGRGVTDIAWTKNPSVLLLIDRKGSLHYLKEINKVKLDGSPVQFKQLERKNVNLDEIKKIIGETSVSV